MEAPSPWVEVAPPALDRVRQSRETLDAMVRAGRVIYGVNTSMGGFVDWLIPIGDARQLQENLLHAVASNVGEPLSDRVVRAAMLARINSLCRGASGISIENLLTYVAILNAGIVPLVPRLGSLGASGDLGPLAAIALACLGKGDVRVRGEIKTAEVALREAGIKPMILSFKEGLALVNGTSVMAGYAALLVEDALRLVRTYELISALSLEGLGASRKPFDPRVHRQKPHEGQLQSATAIFEFLEGSQMIADEALIEKALRAEMSGKPRAGTAPIEDAYSLRCTPQILGPIRETLATILTTITNELNSSNDNPLVLVDHNEVFHNGHFHGQYVAMAMDHLSIALTTLCNLAERRIDRFLDKSSSNGLPAFLCREGPGLRLGLMGGQFMATSVTAEVRSLCVPISTQTLTSTADFQDIVSMGLVAARRAHTIADHLYYVVAFELMCAAQAATIRGADRLAPATRALYDETRVVVPYLDRDEVLTAHIEALARFIRIRSISGVPTRAIPI